MVLHIYGWLIYFRKKSMTLAGEGIGELLVIFMIASLSLSICVGWAACAEIFIPSLLIRGIISFFIILGVYYLSFKFSLWLSGLPASPRTELALDLPDRLGFFFSYPLNQAFCLNVPFNSSQVLPQLAFPLLLSGWIVLVIRRSRKQGWQHILYIPGVLLWWLLGYLPQLIARESFGPYRTMLVLSMMVALLLASEVLLLLKGPRIRLLVTMAMMLLLLVRGVYNYFRYLAFPLSTEYALIRTDFLAHYNDRVREIDFICPPENGFEAAAGIKNFKDEFGMPSSSKDWTPEPLIRQLAFEATGDHIKADRLSVIQWEQGDPPSLVSRPKADTTICIDVPTLLASWRK